MTIKKWGEIRSGNERVQGKPLHNAQARTRALQRVRVRQGVRPVQVPCVQHSDRRRF
ncbi:MAG: hypothetical protein ACFFAS_20665 [Promethearchaeota archaeon]